MPASAPSAPSWWAESTALVERQLKTSSKGLSIAEAERRLKEIGRNELSIERPRRWYSILLHQFSSPLVILLITATLISGALGERTSTIIIVAMIAMGALLAFFQEYRSERVFQTLRRHVTRKATVMRSGRPLRIDARELVPGDLIVLEPGTVVPADMRLIRANDLEVDESVLTGESLPVPKTIKQISGTLLLPQERTNMVYGGTAAVQGTGLGLVVATGERTEFSRAALSVRHPTPETAFQKGIRDLGNLLLVLTAVMTISVFIALAATHHHLSTSLLFALALAVGVSPELLPLIVTLTLTRGALAMSRKHVLVKRLIAIENLGNADVICTDKTGTLTVGALRVREALDAHGEPSREALALAVSCLMRTSADLPANPVDRAIQDEATRLRCQPAYASRACLDTISFDFKRRRMSCVFTRKDGRVIVTKGAVPEVLACCSTLQSNDRQQLLAASERARILAMSERYADQGARVLAVAERSIGVSRRYSPRDEHDLNLIGFIVASDAPKATSKAAIKRFQELGVRLVILTGDNERVTSHVAKSIDFEVTGIKLGEDVELASDRELKSMVDKNNVFARITPSHKLRIIQALKARGLTVACMGDGVNDASALHEADIGISFHEATDVAREAADAVLLRRGLDVVADGIVEGRATFTRTMTYIKATVSSNFGNMLTVAGAAVLLPFIPLLPVQILLLNFISDVPLLAIPTDRVSPESLRRPSHWNIKRLNNNMLIFGLISSMADIATFIILLTVAKQNIALFRSGWFIESVLTEIAIIYMLRAPGLHIFKQRPSVAIITVSIAAVASAFIITQSGLSVAFKFVPLPVSLIPMIIAIVSGYTLLTLLGKLAIERFTKQSL